MARPAPIDLDALRIATPCSASWDEMAGDERKRFCGQCRLNVYDVSALTRGETEALLRRGEGRVCLRLHRRADGRIITKDCGRVRAAIGRRVRWMRAAAASVFAMLGFASCSRTEPAAAPTRAPVAPPERPLMGDVATPPPRPLMGEAVAPASPPGSEMGNVTTGRPVGSPVGQR